MNKDSKIYVAGHTGLLGTALLRKLNEKGFVNVLTRTHKEIDLTDKKAVESFFKKNRPEYIFLAAGKTGGIVANKTYPATFLHENIAIQDNVFEAAQNYEVDHLIFYGSSCIYPKHSPQPIKEEYLLDGKIEETSDAYATAKIAGITACKAYNNQYKTNRFIALVPNSMYGPNDNFNPENSHVLSALIKKFNDAKMANSKEIVLWGSGNPRREFIYSEDVADASIFAMENADCFENRHYNIGTGSDYSIRELSEIISSVIRYNGKIIWSKDKPDGAQRKLLDSSCFFRLGWKPKISLGQGIILTNKWFLRTFSN